MEFLKFNGGFLLEYFLQLNFESFPLAKMTTQSNRQKIMFSFHIRMYIVRNFPSLDL